MEKLEGYIERIKYRSEENGYTVFVVSSGREETTCVGNFLMINEGEYYEMTGSFVNHAMYGRQFQVSNAKIGTPKNVSAMEKYLGSGAIKGIGAAMAKRIVDHFGDATFDIIDKNPERLIEIRGISEKKASEIYKQFEEKREVRDTMLFLQNYGISTTFAVKIYNQYGARTKEIITENPYRLAEDIKGISFEYADNLARNFGFSVDSEYRIKAALIYYMKYNLAYGHSYLPEEVLTEITLRGLSGLDSAVSQVIRRLVDEKSLIAKNVGTERRIYLPVYFYTELSIARMLHDLNVTDRMSDSEMERRVSSVENGLSIELDELQKDALRSALKHALMIITGGPGTGKTTTINALIEMFSMEGAEILLAAPTGRAAKRMSEATGREARTIHRLLEFVPGGMDDDEGKASFNRNAENPLEADLIIIDEASMIDMHLMKSLLSAILVGTRVIFVGDVRQLPSVGPGNVLKDMIESECIEVVRLNKIFRQDEESDIIVNAHMIDRGEHPVMDNKSKDFFRILLPEERSNILGISDF